MPETPEMEIYKNYLTKWVKDKRIIESNVLRAKSLNLESADFCQRMTGRHIKDITRRGKYLIFHLDNDHYLLTHMMLDGRLYYLPAENIETLSQSEVLHSDAEELKQSIKELPGKASVVFGLSDGSVLFFCSLTLGYLHYLGQEPLNEKLQELGKDPLDPNFRAEDFIQLFEGKRGMIKPWLMNPKNIAGVGNAYSNEGLFRAGILPTRLISSLSRDDKVGLYHSLVTILKDSIRLGGDMEERFAPWDDFTGGYNPHFQSYDREGKACLSCHEMIQKMEVGGRNAFFCSHCQK
ncbi:Fpg/Nei family DNA glycosylase [Desulfosporosinus sp. BICA1-9]|uniref:Fpg/Nei family DNA glycosylase n=1 Tax=Desulfosporosinus sp. BICA1-9 TaxID=1531958 RepID=UPI00054BD1E1|nr:DNA-formamidopyrimidine glycosylase family protein [Desulfosporosinus sp. BICA1-9]KJS46327.1 MAG: formamidopyrimidine-DNA glycosylase [Peptococcaceae bacterium BRH_c23]KJS90269.1 MAG: formamidopyrimidine-DNA glycosylase [Desulfosporosinus sp. BICA1-9]HBW34297.1 formamidopyrimidine-DNA glycosylase [Desulfosporosinus sp.]